MLILLSRPVLPLLLLLLRLPPPPRLMLLLFGKVTMHVNDASVLIAAFRLSKSCSYIPIPLNPKP